jgi:hypothetical protein
VAAVVRYARGDGRHEAPDSVIDAYLLKAFPGRTLEELDGLDWGRWQRALEAQMHLDVERLRTQVTDGSIKGSDLPDGVADMILKHDALVEDEDDGDA